jgi:isocitrate dehydrogenase
VLRYARPSPRTAGALLREPGAAGRAGGIPLPVSCNYAAVISGRGTTFAEGEATAAKGPGGRLYVTNDIARQFPGYGEKAGTSSSAFADRIIH